MTTIDVVKLNLDFEETFRYSGKVIEQKETAILIEAFFNRPDLPFYGVVFANGDRFLEAYSSNHGFNIFEIYGKDRGELKGWYCNISMPASILSDHVSFIDLFLDLLVLPDGRKMVLDEDEFYEAEMPDDIRNHARRSLIQLQDIMQPGFRLEEWFAGI